jgi:hypothetical protein
VRRRAAQFLGSDDFVRDRFDHVRAGHEHVGAVLDHEDEVGHGRRVNGAAGAGSHDHGDLRDHARGQHVALKHLGIAAQRHHAFLDARTAGVIEADDRRADLHRLIHDFADLFGVGLRQGAAEHREILAEDEHHAPVDRAVTGDDAVAEHLFALHAEVGAAVLDELVPFLEAALVQQQLQALARGQFAAVVLGVDALLPAAEGGRPALLFQLFDDFLHCEFPVVRPIPAPGIRISRRAREPAAALRCYPGPHARRAGCWCPARRSPRRRLPAA